MRCLHIKKKKNVNAYKWFVGSLITHVAFASSTTLPSGTDEKSGKPTRKPAHIFDLFMVSSLIALCFWVTSLIMFLAILSSRGTKKKINSAWACQGSSYSTQPYLFISTSYSTCHAHSKKLDKLNEKLIMKYYKNSLKKISKNTFGKKI